MKFLLVLEDKLQVIAQGKKLAITDLPLIHKFYHRGIAAVHRCNVIIRVKPATSSVER